MSKCWHLSQIIPHSTGRCASSPLESPAKLVSLVILRPIPAQLTEINKIVEQSRVNPKPFRLSQVEIQPDSPLKNKLRIRKFYIIIYPMLQQTEFLQGHYVMSHKGF